MERSSRSEWQRIYPRHVEAVDLTRDDTEEDPAPQVLTEEDHRLGQMRALEEGSVALEPSQDEVPVDQ